MGSTFDIFKLTADGGVWVTAALDLPEAERRMARFGLVSPGEYFRFTHRKMVS